VDIIELEKGVIREGDFKDTHRYTLNAELNVDLS
jgi:hypothetical protein